jgi:hypothetical protein
MSGIPYLVTILIDAKGSLHYAAHELPMVHCFGSWHWSGIERLPSGGTTAHSNPSYRGGGHHPGGSSRPCNRDTHANRLSDSHRRADADIQQHPDGCAHNGGDSRAVNGCGGTDSHVQRDARANGPPCSDGGPNAHDGPVASIRSGASSGGRQTGAHGRRLSQGHSPVAERAGSQQ